MAVRRQSVSFNDFCWDIVQRATEMWPEHGDNISATICKIIAEWGRQTEGGGKTTKIIERIDEADVKAEARHNEIMEVISARKS